MGRRTERGGLAIARSFALTTGEAFMSSNRLISIIQEKRSTRALWRKLSDEGRNRVIEIANGSDFMLETILEDVYDEEKGR
jgi:hypothetical protein